MRLMSRLSVVQYDPPVTRADAIENRERLIAVTGELLDELGEVSLIDLARVTGLGRATVYRHFSSTEAVVEAYVLRELGDFLDLGRRPIADGGGVARLRELCSAWADLVERSGAALVHVRSTEGFLRRAAGGDLVIAPIHEVMSAVFGACAHDGHLVAFDPTTAVFYWNLLLDPRDVIDLAEYRGIDVIAAADLLTSDLFRLLGLED